MSNGNKSIWVKILAGILAFLMVGSMCFTVIFYLIRIAKA